MKQTNTHLNFERQKYGQELLIDTTHTSEFLLEGEASILPNFYTIACLTEAQGEMLIAEQRINLVNNMMLFIPFGQLVNIQKAEFIEGYFLFFEKEFLDVFFHEQNFVYKFAFFHSPNNPLFIECHHDILKTFYDIIKEVHHEIRNLRSDSEHIIRSLLYYFLVKANRLYAESHHLSDTQILNNEYLISFKALLERDVRQHSNVQFYADSLKISRTYLNKLCLNHFSRTSIQVVRERLLIEAKKDLLYTRKTIAEIAYDLQFSDPPNFSRFFKQLTGQSPQQFRELSN